jgi:hypothetical protein
MNNNIYLNHLGIIEFELKTQTKIHIQKPRLMIIGDNTEFTTAELTLINKMMLAINLDMNLVKINSNYIFDNIEYEAILFFTENIDLNHEYLQHKYCISTHHPRKIIANPADKAKVWKDLLNLKSYLGL